MWKFHRGMARQFFTRDRISDFDNFERHASHVISLMKKRFSEGYSVDCAVSPSSSCHILLDTPTKQLQDAVGRFTLDSATVHLYGSDVRSLDAGLPYAPYEISGKVNPTSFNEHPSNAFVHAFAAGQNILTLRGKSGAMWRRFEPWRDEIKPFRATIDEYIQPLIEEAVQKKEAGHSEEAATLLDHLLRDAKGTFTRRFL